MSCSVVPESVSLCVPDETTTSFIFVTLYCRATSGFSWGSISW